MEQEFCQSCGMPLTKEIKGTNADGSCNKEYCIYCYKDGTFTKDFTMNQMIEFCALFTDQMNSHSGRNLTSEQAKEQMRRFFPQLKRWREDKRTLTEKAVALLAQCHDVTLASVNEDGYPRPVSMAKVCSQGYTEIWTTTGSGSEKVADFKRNKKAGLCYSAYGDSVALRGTVQVVTDDNIRQKMWQEWFIHHFPAGPTDPDYVLLHFLGREATIYIDGEFVHKKIG